MFRRQKAFRLTSALLRLRTIQPIRFPRMAPLFGCSPNVLALGVNNPASLPAIYMDFSGLPITPATIPNGTMQFVFLHCQPNPTIATREFEAMAKGP